MRSCGEVTARGRPGLTHNVRGGCGEVEYNSGSMWRRKCEVWIHDVLPGELAGAGGVG